MHFELDLPARFNAAEYFIDRNIREGRADKIAIRCGNAALTYGDVCNGVNRFGNMLLNLGMRMEERVALLLLDTPVYPQAFFGAIKTGAVPICLNTLLAPKDYEYFLNDSRATVLVVDAALLGSIESIRDRIPFVKHIIVANGEAPEGDLVLADIWENQSAELDAAPTTPDDSCFWLYSSGTTGQSKGTVHLHADMVYSCETYGKQVLGVKEDDVCFSAAKLFFAYGLGNGLYFPFSVGATAVYLSGRPTPEAVYQTVAEFKPTIFFGVPTLFAQMMEEEGELNGVRICVSAGEALPADIFKRWRDRFSVDILDGIGSTELVHIFISNRIGEIRPGCTGRLVPGYEAQIVDENMQEVPTGEVGTLLVKGGTAAPYYWNKRQKSIETMLGPWLNTGDKFFQDEEGLFFYAGRTDDMLKVGGIWLSPVEVEACIIEHPAVLESAVVPAVTDEDLVKPKAYVVLNGSRDASEELEKEIKDHVKQTLANYKYPRWIEFIDELPKTATGKIKRFVLRQREE